MFDERKHEGGKRMEKRRISAWFLIVLTATSVVLFAGLAYFWFESEYPGLPTPPPMLADRSTKIESLRETAIRRMDAGDYEESLVLIEQGLSLSPDSTRLLELQALVEQKMSSQMVPHEPPVDVLSAVDRVLMNMAQANVAFNAPSSMVLNETKIIHLILDARRSIEELRSMIVEGGDVGSDVVRISDRMEARLTGHSFQITAITSEIQAVSKTLPTEWKWELRPIEPGDQYLHVTLSAFIDPGNGLAPRVIRTFDKLIHVKVQWHKRLTAFAQENWQWLWATLLVPAAGWVWKIRNSRKTTQGKKTL
jgi:hypothetical protein